MVTSSETWSEEARAGADILDLDRYMRGSRPARRAAPPHVSAHAPRDMSSSGLVVDGGAAGAGAGRGSSSASSASASEPSDKRFSHDSGLSDTTYRHQRADRRKKVVRSFDSRSDAETIERRRSNKSGGEAKERRRRKTSEGEATERRGKKSGGEAARHVSSESSRNFRESLERALREQQAQIARVAALCERQAQAQAQARSERSERHSERHRARSHKSGERRAPRVGSGAGETRTSSGTSDLSSSYSSLGPHKRPGSECRTYKIIMSKLDELNRLFAARRAAPAVPAPAAAAVLTRARTRQTSSGSVTVSDKVVGTDSRQHQTRHARASVVEAGAVDIPPRTRRNVVTESVVRGEGSAPASEKGMPGRFHLDDPVRLYQQAKRLDAARAERRDSASGSSGSRGSAHGSAHGSSQGSSRGSARGSPSLCALCRCYWTVARRYLAAQLTSVRE